MIMPPPRLQDDARLSYALNSWYRWRGNKRLPGRADINADDFRRLLPNIYLLERAADGRWRFILSGATVRNHLGFELSGRYLEDLFDAEQLDRTKKAYDAVLRGNADYMLQTWSRQGRPVMQFRRLLLPLASDSGDEVALIMGIAFYDPLAGHDGNPINHLSDPVDIAIQTEEIIPLAMDAPGP